MQVKERRELFIQMLEDLVAEKPLNLIERGGLLKGTLRWSMTTYLLYLRHSTYYGKDRIENGKCDTACCAAGHYCLLQEVRDEGVLIVDEHSNISLSRRNWVGTSALASYFEIYIDDSEQLFYPDEYNDKDLYSESGITAAVVLKRAQRIFKEE